MSGGKMTEQASGTFDVHLDPMASDDLTGAPVLQRLRIHKVFHGDLEGESKGQMLAATTPLEGSAGYVAIEVVSGKLKGRSGSFILQHNGIMERGEGRLSVVVVPDSGTDQLSGLAGVMTITITTDQHRYTFDYTI
jgi:hypothetical protein